MHASAELAPQTRVLYIAGTGRSGSTLLAAILGQVHGVTSIGELRFLWERGIIEDRLCGCGARFHSCPVWAGILAEAFAGGEYPDPHDMVRAQRAGGRVRHVPLMLATRADGIARMAPPAEYRTALARLYAAVSRVLGADLIVDSSKLPAYGRTLESIPSVEVSIVHLVRDPRAAAYSWLRHKPQPDRVSPGYMERRGVVRSAALWSLWNSTAEAFWRRSTRYVLVRYEDFVAEPQVSVRRILAMVGAEKRELPFAGERSVLLGTSHTVAGNPARFQTGTLELRADDEWMSRMRRKDRAAVTALTLPLLARYRYPILVSRR